MNLPPIPGSFTQAQQLWLRDLTVAVDKEVKARIPQNAPVNQVLLASPSKKVFAVSVDDAGVISAVLVQE